MQDFRNLRVWQKAHELTLEVYKCTRQFPREELYGVTSQMRRAAASISANLAEGCCRQGDTEFSRFAQIALGSVSELEYFLLLSRDLSFLNNDEYERLNNLVNETKRMLISLIQKLRSQENAGNKNSG
jgi:four helix bundle protein